MANYGRLADVKPVVTPKSFNHFVAYYYTKEPPLHWNRNREIHSTKFRARPDERFKRNVLMPLERTARLLRGAIAGLKRRIKG